MMRLLSRRGEKPARRWPVRLILFGIVFALVLPGLLFCAVLLNQIATAERTRSEETAQSAAVRTAETIDRELSSLLAAMVALSTSPALDKALDAGGDTRVFGEQARAVAQALGHDVVLSDADGQQLTNSRVGAVPFAPGPGVLPHMSNMEIVRAAIRTRAPMVSGLFTSGSSGDPTLAVIVPILRDGRVPGVVGINVRPQYISGLLMNQNLPTGWIAAVIDGADRVFARTEPFANGIGPLANADVRAHSGADSGIWVGTQLNGVRVLTAMRRQRVADWRVVVSVPSSIVDAPLRSTVMLLVVTGVITLSIAGVLAWRLASSLGVPLQRLAAASGALAEGRPIAEVESAISEVDAVSRALVQATRDLRARADALAAERAQLAAVIETVPVGLIIAEGPEGRIVAGNQYLARMLRQPLIQRESAEYGAWVAYHPDGRLVGPEEYPLARVLDGAAQAEIQCVFQRGDGTPLWIQCAAAPIVAGDGSITGGVVAVLDIDDAIRGRETLARFAESLEAEVAQRTAALEAANQRLRDEVVGRRAAEEQLRQAQKMEAVGQLTGGIAHDFNNMLTVVMGSLDLLRRRAQDDRSKRLLDNAMDGTVRAATLTARLLAFSRRQPLNAQVLDVNSLVAGMSDLLHRTLGAGLQVETVLAEGLWQTLADANQLENALLNLAVNARDAMSDNDKTPGMEHIAGRLVIETGNVVLDAADLSGEPDVMPGDYVLVAVTDNGSGMPEAVVSRVFEPFFTTKPQGQGTGLGLSQVHGFVKQSGGHVAIRTGPGEGTTVSVYLPRYTGLPEAEAGVREGAAPAGTATRLTVLAVEDKADVLQYSVEALRELGHLVLEAEDGAEALRLLDAHPEIGLVFTDVMLRQMNGARLAEEIERRRPGLPILFTSGYTGGGTGVGGNERDATLAAGSLLLRKPFDLSGLEVKLREAMAR